MKSTRQLSRFATIAAIVSILLVSCSDPVEPTPVNSVLEVDEVTGETTVDTNDLGDEWPSGSLPRPEEIPFVIRQFETEQMGSEISGVFVKAVITPYLVKMLDGEDSQFEAVAFMVNQMGLADEVDSVTNAGGKGVGVFDDDSTQSVWGYISTNLPTNELEALNAYALVAEYQYNLALDASKSAESESVKLFWKVCVASNKNQFMGVIKQVYSAGSTYKNKFLTDTEYSDVQDDAFVKF